MPDKFEMHLTFMGNCWKENEAETIAKYPHRRIISGLPQAGPGTLPQKDLIALDLVGLYEVS